MNFAKTIIYSHHGRDFFDSTALRSKQHRHLTFREGRVFQLSLSVSFSHFVTIHTLSVCPRLAPIFFLLRSPSASRAACTHTYARTRTYVCTYVRTFRHLTIVTRSIVHRRRHRRKGRARLSEASQSHSFHAAIFSAARYRRTWHWGSPERERERERERENCNVTQRSVSRHRYRRYRDVAMRRAAASISWRRSVSLPPHDAGSVHLSPPPSLLCVPSYAYIQPNANGACRRALDICLTRELCVGCLENSSKDLHLSSRWM